MRRLTTYLVLVLLLSLVLVPVAAADKGTPPTPGPNALSIAGPALLGPATAGPARPGPDALINDGSFENVPPPASAWTEITDQPCEWIGDWSSVWGLAAYDGVYDYWGGGYCSDLPTTSSVSQTVTLPVTDTVLYFWYVAYRPDADDADPDTAYISVNGTNVWTLNLIQANNTYPNWVEANVDLTAYAGQTVSLVLGAISQGTSTGNIRYDYIQVGTPPPPPPRCDTGYHEVDIATQDFTGTFPPAGWNVVNNGGACVWVNTDPGGNGNLTGGTGEFAIADSDDCGSVLMDTELWSGQLNLTNVISPELEFKTDYYSYSGNEYGDVDISTDAGATWANVQHFVASARGPRTWSGAIPGAGQNDVMVRWHYANANWDWWWEVDDMVVTGCVPDVPASVDLSGIEASPVAPLAGVPVLALPAGLALLGGAAWAALKRRR